MSKYKTKWEYEEEDSNNHRRRMENIQRRRDLKRAEEPRYSCNFEGCGQHFEDFSEFDAHCRKHQEDNRRKMICNKVECKDLKVRALVAKLCLNVKYIFCF